VPEGITPGSPVRIGVVLPYSGRLASLGHPLAFAGQYLAQRLRTAVGAGRSVELTWRDSYSNPVAAAWAAQELAADNRVVLVLTMAGTKVVPAVAGTCAAVHVPCLSTALPWQVYCGRDALSGPRLRWAFHFCWGLDDIAAVFADLWQQTGPDARIGCLWNNDRQGAFLRDPTQGFLPEAAARGYDIFDPGGYGEPAASFVDHLDRLQTAGVNVVTSAAIPADLALFRQQAHARGWTPRLITCSRWLAYPTAPSTAADVATVIYWTPRHPFVSSLDGSTPGELAHAYQQQTGRQWLQPLGLAYALFEVAAHALAIATDPTDRAAVASALSSMRLDTIAGPLDWSTGPTPNVARIHLAGGQWHKRDGRCHLAIITNSSLPHLTEADGLPCLRRGPV
jgi:branched-chain amino acid transport system substrate-binding protein